MKARGAVVDLHRREDHRGREVVTRCPQDAERHTVGEDGRRAAQTHDDHGQKADGAQMNELRSSLLADPIDVALLPHLKLDDLCAIHKLTQRRDGHVGGSHHTLGVELRAHANFAGEDHDAAHHSQSCQGDRADVHRQ